MVAVSLVHPTPSHRKVTTQKNKKEKPFSFIPPKDKKMGKLKGCICSVTVGKDKKTLQARGCIFGPKGLCGVPAKSGRLLKWKGGIAVFCHLKEG